MNFELGKEYVVKVSEEGIIPIEEFKSDSDVLNKIRDEIEEYKSKQGTLAISILEVLDIINKYKESEK